MRLNSWNDRVRSKDLNLSMDMLDSLMIKELLSASAIALTFIAFYPYIRSILQGKTKPHAIS